MRSVALAGLVLLLSGCTTTSLGGMDHAGSAPADSQPCIKGVLVDGDVMPVPHATVTIEQTGESATTGDDGSYCLHFPDGASMMHVHAGDRHWMMECHHGDGQPEGCQQVK